MFDFLKVLEVMQINEGWDLAFWAVIILPIIIIILVIIAIFVRKKVFWEDFFFIISIAFLLLAPFAISSAIWLACAPDSGRILASALRVEVDVTHPSYSKEMYEENFYEFSYANWISDKEGIIIKPKTEAAEAFYKKEKNERDNEERAAKTYSYNINLRSYDLSSDGFALAVTENYYIAIKINDDGSFEEYKMRKLDTKIYEISEESQAFVEVTEVDIPPDTNLYEKTFKLYIPKNAGVKDITKKE